MAEKEEFNPLQHEYHAGEHPGHEREFETGMSESFTQSSINKDRLYTSNDKRTYDVHQDLDLKQARSTLDYADERARSNNRNADVVNSISQQALQNAVTTSDMLQKQALKAFELGLDRQWNVDEVANMATIVAKTLDNVVQTRAVDSATAKSTDTSAIIQTVLAAMAVLQAKALNKDE